MHLDVVICTHDPARHDVLTQVLQAVDQELVGDDRRILINDGPATVHGAVRNRGPRGLSGARNTGVAEGRNEIIVFIDDDAVPRPGWRDAVVDAFQDDTVVGAGGRVLPAGELPEWVPPEHLWVLGCDFNRVVATERRNPIGAAMVIRRDAVEAVGGFSTAFGRVGKNASGGEETELFIRIDEPAVQIPNFVVDHHIDESRLTPFYFLRRGYAEGRMKAALAQHLDDESSHVGHSLSSILSHVRRKRIGRALVSAAVLGTTGLGYLTGRDGAAITAEPKKKVQLSVALCTNGANPALPQALESVLTAVEGLDAEVLLVDNSRDGRVADSPSIVTWKDRFRAIRAPIAGLSHARNVALNHARGEWLAYMDDDAVVDKTWVTTMLEHTVDDTVWCVTGRTLPTTVDSEASALFEASVSFDKGSAPRRWTLDSSDTPPLYPWPAGNFGSGNNMMWRTDALRAMGGFCPQLGAGRPTRGGEDLDAFRRVILGGGAIDYVPDAVIYHHHRPTMGSLAKQMFGYGSGMAASLTRAVLDHPRAVVEILLGAPQAAVILVRDRLQGTKGQVEDAPSYPLALVGVELAGYAAGPVLLLLTTVRDSVVALFRRTRA